MFRYLMEVLSRPAVRRATLEADARCRALEEENALLRAEIIREEVWLDQISAREGKILRMEESLDGVRSFLETVGADPDVIERLGSGNVPSPHRGAGMLSLKLDPEKVAAARSDMPPRSFGQAMSTALSMLAPEGEDRREAS